MSITSIVKLCKSCGAKDRSNDGRCIPCRRRYEKRRGATPYHRTVFDSGRLKHEHLRDMREIESGPDYSLNSIKI